MVSFFINLKRFLKRYIKHNTVFYCYQVIIFKGPLFPGGALLSEFYVSNEKN